MAHNKWEEASIRPPLKAQFLKKFQKLHGGAICERS